MGHQKVTSLVSFIRSSWAVYHIHHVWLDGAFTFGWNSYICQHRANLFNDSKYLYTQRNYHILRYIGRYIFIFSSLSDYLWKLQITLDLRSLVRSVFSRSITRIIDYKIYERLSPFVYFANFDRSRLCINEEVVRSTVHDSANCA